MYAFIPVFLGSVSHFTESHSWALNIPQCERNIEQTETKLNQLKVILSVYCNIFPMVIKHWEQLLKH